MRVVVSILVSVLSVAAVPSPALLDLAGLIGEPLAIFVKQPLALIAPPPSAADNDGKTTTAGSSSSSSSSSSSLSSSSSNAHGGSTSGNSASLAPPATPWSSSDSSSSSGSSSIAPPPPPPVPPVAGGIPDGQGNSFTTVAGAVRFPWNYGNADNVVPITPGSSNGGWAMSPNQQCRANAWCPYACAPGYYSAQWDPSAVSYNGRGSMNGGLFADAAGRLSKPFPEKPFCSPGMFNARVVNRLAQSVSACQTVYPGNEAMIIPSVAPAGGSVSLNVVPSSYWLGTSSQFYVNLAGSSADQCIWGDNDRPIGNWAPYIFGAGQAKDGNTYISVQYNPLYASMGFKAADAYSVKIVCTAGKCNFPPGGQCKCEQGVCSVNNGCTVTLPAGATADFILY
ncbi:hypothetical protein GGI20_002576 [Coemansia sp. BCRC 34301]|nr:hypothetical protein GGI20_002576 [Coemansia sp. BCRC 34301]